MAQAKSFFIVFPDLKVSDNMKQIFENVLIDEVVYQKKSNTLCIHFHCEHIISRIDTWKMAKQIREQLFSKRFVKVRFHEAFQLSDQYNTEHIVNNYIKSFLFDLKGQGEVIFNVVRKSNIEVNENIINITLEDTFINRSKSVDIKEYFESVFQDRFQREVKVGFHFTDKIDNALKKESQYKLQKEIEEIVEQADQVAKEHENDQKAAKKKETFDYNKKYAKKRIEDDPTLLYGRNVEGDLMEIKEVFDEIGEIVVRGQIFEIETREIRNEKSIIMFSVTDFTDSIRCKIFVKNEQLPDVLSGIAKGKFIRIKGMAIYDKFDHEITLSSVIGIKMISDFRQKRQDNMMDKRVELHMHTVMSDNDSVVQIKEIVQRAHDWGHKALAITDHGVLQAFPIARHAYEDLRLEEDDPFKIIYGVEGYFVDDLGDLVQNDHGQSLDDSYVVFDIETTGFNNQEDRIIEIGAVKVIEGKITETFSEFVNPQIPIPFRITQLTTITDQMVIDADTISEVLPRFFEFSKGSILVAHNANFDIGFIKENAKRLNLTYDYTSVDTLGLGRCLLPHLGKFTLDNICKNLNIKLETHHRAVDDATATGKIFVKFIEMLNRRELDNLSKVNDFVSNSEDFIKKSMSYHGIILVKNNIGRVNLNRLVSEAHIHYFNRRPRMPKSLINKYREGLILGSACEAGELYRAIVDRRSDEEIAKIVEFYDYLEIQPLGNNKFMIESNRYENINSMDDVEAINRRIVELGEIYHKPVVATCDVHFLDPDDSIYRAILMAGKGFKDADDQPPLYFRTTEEMLDEFAYLGSDKAREVVITNPNKINEMIENISPIHPDKCPPVIENSDRDLRDICYNRAHEIYGPNLPERVTKRLDRELDSIIGNGYAVMYIIAQKLVWDSNDHGYLVGSRGSVGSSFAATMSGITEVNPLPAHYICPNCYYVDFDSDQVKEYASKGMSGYDMPDAVCPKCGKPLRKEGHDIPFETFLGFKGDKEPDIDLNFSGEYQGKAHAYVEVIFGKGKAFRAGTIGTLAEKTAYGYVLKYLEERGISKRKCEIERLAMGCTGVKRTTGQHPGGIIVVPHDKEIYDFTAIQHPANDMKTPIITTHFEYHSIDQNLLKLDILGHDDPSMIRRMEDITGVNAADIPLDDPSVMELFHGTKILGITPEDIGGTPLGSLGVPEFGTDFVIQMLQDTNPQSFSDLVRISGLSHGTNVWLDNAQTLIQNGECEISTAICTRDDIMVYLINQGLDEALSFTTMEAVRKGKGLKPEMEEAMKEKGVPDWYIWSCKQIKYMFPKAHAVAYVMMAWRIAWFKVFHPLAYYAAYFSIRAKSFSYADMCMGKEHLMERMKEITSVPKEQAKPADLDLLREMKIADEMYARGFEFMPLDIYKAKAVDFQVMDGKLMPAFSSLDGMGEKAARAAEEAGKGEPYTSLENFRNRTKAPKAVIDLMSELGIMGDLEETDQLQFQFDM
ncbi:MAG: PolC-type DNA polymerase III [Anaerostipes sp.]|nr:PolC-type DNA polymerase III [Anaerostipes sp.]